ncbi:MAG: hypothetical protein WBQ68_09310 [Terriglobales bacterium]
MARGWESKSVEEQQSAANTQVASKQRLTPEEAARKQERDALELSRRNVLQQLQVVQNPLHRQMLESARVDLEARLTRLG